MNDDNLDKYGEDVSRIRRKKENRKHETRSFILSLIAALVIALLLRFFVFEFIRVEGDSMNQTLHDNEYVFMERVTYWFSEPGFGDIVICTFPNSPGVNFVKRVIGTGGDEIEIKDGILYINGKPDHQDYTYFAGSTGHETDRSAFVVPENTVFVMGDNRNRSRDSRFPEIGPLPYDRILGKAVFVIWPPESFGGLE